MKNEETPLGAPPNTIDKDVSPYKFVVPSQFQDLHFRFLKVRKGGKEAVEPGWQKTKNYSWHDPEIRNWISRGGNYGIACPSGFCVFVDADTKKIQETLETKLPLTFRYSTGKEGHFQYVYFVEDEAVGCIPLLDGAYIKGRGGYALGPGSVHPNGTVYGSREIRNVPVAVVKNNSLMNALEPFLLKKQQNTAIRETIQERVEKVTPEQIKKVAVDIQAAWKKADHKRHILTLAIIGACERSGWSQSDIQVLINTLIKTTGKGQEHASQVRYAYGRSERTYGFPTLKALLEELGGDSNDQKE